MFTFAVERFGYQVNRFITAGLRAGRMAIVVWTPIVDPCLAISTP
jgi:hypothetical protein